MKITDKEIMKYKEAPNGYKIDQGDILQIDNALDIRNFKISRVTNNYAFVAWNDKAEGKFPRIYNTLGFSVIPRVRWKTTMYRIFIKIDSSDDQKTT